MRGGRRCGAAAVPGFFGAGCNASRQANQCSGVDETAAQAAGCKLLVFLSIIMVYPLGWVSEKGGHARVVGAREAVGHQARRHARSPNATGWHARNSGLVMAAERWKAQRDSPCPWPPR